MFMSCAKSAWLLYLIINILWLGMDIYQLAITGRELTRTDAWGSGVEYFYFMTHFGK